MYMCVCPHVCVCVCVLSGMYKLICVCVCVCPYVYGCARVCVCTRPCYSCFRTTVNVTSTMSFDLRR